ncbi:mitochondrial DNA helicase [Onthophagus taurus]|uniref:mitochondrial DNA helicase n=1 Tax=Onthophagus taurus TaxID=166361 RepID=UPI0039BE2007
MFFKQLFIKTKSISKLRLQQIPGIFYRNINNIALDDTPHITSSEIKKVLNGNNVSFEEGYTCYLAKCSVCNVDTKRHLYINKITGFFICTKCKLSGEWGTLEEGLKKNINSKRKKLNALNRKDFVTLGACCEQDKIKDYLEKIQTNTNDIKSLSQSDFLNIFESFKLPQVSNKILDTINIRIDNKHENLYFQLDNADQETVGYKVLNVISNKYKVEPSQTCTGILYAKLRPKETAVVVANVPDFLILVNHKPSVNVICLPNGLINISQFVLTSLERFNKLILWFGNDVESWDSARTFAKKLGEKRCLFIRPTDQHQLPHLAPEQDFKAIISSAQPIVHKSITTFSSLREDVFSDLQNIDKVQGVKWKRFPTLNKILKGHRKGELTILTGPTGCGKTTFISEYSLDLAMQGVNTLWGSFEIRNARLARTMLQQYAGIQLDEHLDQFDFWADKFEKLPVYFMTFHGQQSIKIVMEAVEHATYVHDISHVIIDNLQFMMGMTEDSKTMDRFWKQDLIVAAVRNFATKKNCHVTLVIHPRKEKVSEDLTTSSIFGGAKATQEADNVLIIQDQRLNMLRGKKFIQIAKNRYSGDLGIMNLEFIKEKLSYAQKKKKLLTQDVSNDQKEIN